MAYEVAAEFITIAGRKHRRGAVVKVPPEAESWLLGGGYIRPAARQTQADKAPAVVAIPEPVAPKAEERTTSRPAAPTIPPTRRDPMGGEG